MTTLDACDFAYPPGNVTIESFYRTLRARGILVVQRYLWPGGKGITAREKAAAAAAGVHIVYGYEGYASNWRGGAAQGVRDAAAAAGIAKSLGVPAGTPIYYAVDEDAAGLGMLNTAAAYVHAANRPDYPARAYGQFAVAEALRLPTFQTYAWPPRNPDGTYRFGAISRYCALYQWHNNQPLAGGTVDFCEVLDPAALGLVSPDPLEQIMSWYPDRPTYEAAMAHCAQVGAAAHWSGVQHNVLTDHNSVDYLTVRGNGFIGRDGVDHSVFDIVTQVAPYLQVDSGGNVKVKPLPPQQPRPHPARVDRPSPHPRAAVEAPLVAQNMHTDDPRASTPTLSDQLIGGLRTGVPALVGALLTFLAVKLHFVISPSTTLEVDAAVFALVTTAYRTLLGKLEQRWKWVGVLLGYPAQPTYSSGKG